MTSSFALIISGMTLIFIILAFAFALSMIIRAIRGDSRKRDPEASVSETKLIQEIHHGLSKMESRIDSLETILMAKEENAAEEKKLHDFERKIERG